MVRWTEAEYTALTGKKAPKKQTKKIIAGGYESCWRGWRTVGGQKCYFRSLWEYNFGTYLEWLRCNGNILRWEHEPQYFEYPRLSYKRAPFGYKPDFRAYNKKLQHQWYEVKGHMTPSSKKKIDRFHKHFPEEGKIQVIDAQWFTQNSRTLRQLVPGWKSLQQMQESER